MQLDTFFRNLRKVAAGKKFRLNSNGAIRLRGSAERNRHPVNPVTLVAKAKNAGNFKVSETDDAGKALGLDSLVAFRLTNAIEYGINSNERNRLLKTLNLV